MTDIVERLSIASEWHNEGFGPLCAEAAAEIARLRAAQQWRPIAEAPKDGTEIIVFHRLGGVCAALCPDDGFAWHCMDVSNTGIGRVSGNLIPTMTSFMEPPSHWMPLPSPPTKEGAG